MRICHFEDARVATLEPLALSRPAFELRCGMTTLGQKQRRFFQADAVGALIRPFLAASVERDHPNIEVNDLGWLGEGATVLVNARWLPPARTAKLLPETLRADGPCVAVIEDEIAYAVLTPDELGQCTYVHMAHCFDQWRRTLPNRPAGGQMIRYLWELVDANAEQIEVDFQAQRLAEPTGRPGTLTLIGPSDWLRVDPTARIDPFVVADTSNGPVIIDRDAVISSFTRLEGPCWVGPRTQVFGANVRGGTSIGPNCRIGGEVEASIIQGHTNKYHQGFLGHSYLGEWINLGAGTHTSDLRNDYGEVKMTINGAHLSTGRKKVGAFIGDHTKTGLGSLINTGTNVGVFGNLLPAGELLPKFVPSFSWVEHGRITDRADLPALFATADKAMERRGEQFGETQRALFQSLYEKTAAVRRQWINEANIKRLRRAG
jgi:UDP-N-acetylglucosamine diphosphorylase / glucose-1-phosphate thymidylyltransferase / UDP-N-acetylgalactosamine diphosphorylase / glucosamine-1-phosphate N-acetyltransferase / galactosamine-1-phosphate N-acetyltransferase